jgi:hypothetical protein
MKRVFCTLLFALVVAAIYLCFFPFGQRRDRSFDTRVAHPAFADRHPVMLFDEGHNNAHTSRTGFRPFAELMRHDGFDVRATEARFTPVTLRAANVLVIVNADGGTNPKLFGINLEPLRKGVRGSPALLRARSTS